VWSLIVIFLSTFVTKIVVKRLYLITCIKITLVIFKRARSVIQGYQLVLCKSI